MGVLWVNQDPTTSNGGVIRPPVQGVRRNKDRATMGVKLMNLPERVTIVSLGRPAEQVEPEAQEVR